MKGLIFRTGIALTAALAFGIGSQDKEALAQQPYFRGSTNVEFRSPNVGVGVNRGYVATGSATQRTYGSYNENEGGYHMHGHHGSQYPIKVRAPVPAVGQNLHVQIQTPNGGITDYNFRYSQENQPVCCPPQPQWQTIVQPQVLVPAQPQPVYCPPVQVQPQVLVPVQRQVICCPPVQYYPRRRPLLEGIVETTQGVAEGTRSIIGGAAMITGSAVQGVGNGVEYVGAGLKNLGRGARNLGRDISCERGYDYPERVNHEFRY